MNIISPDKAVTKLKQSLIRQGLAFAGLGLMYMAWADTLSSNVFGYGGGLLISALRLKLILEGK